LLVSGSLADKSEQANQRLFILSVWGGNSDRRRKLLENEINEQVAKKFFQLKIQQEWPRYMAKNGSTRSQSFEFRQLNEAAEHSP
jgi:hypothetical protein